MATNQTANYGLNQWEAEDAVLRTEFNADNQKIDEALGGIALNNCKMFMGSYEGTGERGDGALVLQFPFKPMVVFMHVDYLDAADGIVAYHILFRDKNTGYGMTGASKTLVLTWGEDSLQVSCTSAGTASSMFNASGMTYRYIALGI